MNNLVKRIVLPLFISIATIIYILFIFFSNHVPVIKLEYAGILLCFAVSFMLYGDRFDTWTVRIALLFTVIADLFLLILEGFELIGVTVFCIVQIIYGIRLSVMNIHKSVLKNTLIIRFLNILLFQVIGFILIENGDLLSFVTFFYFANLVTNVILAFYNWNTNVYFSIGLFLFMWCDVFVGLNNSKTYINISSDSIWNQLLNLPIDLMWFFYYPSQVLITVSILTNKGLLNKAKGGKLSNQ